jgi:general secretion pathway protein F
VKYVLRVFDTNGAVQTVHVESDSTAAAASLARARGLRVVSVRGERGSARLRLRTPALARGKFNVELFARELAALLSAGVGVVDALRTLASNERRERSAAVYRGLLRRLEEGQSLSAALEQASDVFPVVLVACVKASEQTGGLADSLTRYSRNSAMLHELRGRVVSAAIYPTVLLVVGAVVVLFLLGFVVPRFATLLEHSGRELPLLSQLLIAWGSMVHAHGKELAIGFAVLAFAASIVLRRPSARDWIADRMLALPGIGEYFRVFRQSQFFRTTAMLVDGGIPAIRAFDLACGLVGRSDQASLARALAEKTGGLGPVLDRIAAFQESQVARAIDLISRLIEPAMMIFIGIVIGGIVVLMYMPIFEIASSVQ